MEQAHTEIISKNTVDHNNRNRRAAEAESDDSPTWPPRTWGSLKTMFTIIGIGASFGAAFIVMQNQVADGDKERAEMRAEMRAGFKERQAVDRVQDSMLTIINYERAHGLLPSRPPVEKARGAVLVVEKQGSPKRHPQDHTQVDVDFAGLWTNFPFPSSINGAGWSRTEGRNPRSRDTIIRGEP